MKRLKIQQYGDVWTIFKLMQSYGGFYGTKCVSNFNGVELTSEMSYDEIEDALSGIDYPEEEPWDND
ncbi:MAG: hypothetical protein ACRCUJ_07815 [Phocaeicola sp.]